MIKNNFDIDTNLHYLNILQEELIIEFSYQTTIFDEILFLCHELKSLPIQIYKNYFFIPKIFSVINEISSYV